MLLCTLLLPDEIGLSTSPGMFDGGVSRFPTLLFAWFVGIGCETYEGKLGNLEGGGNSKLGRFDVADRRAVKLVDALIGSKAVLRAGG